MTNLKFKRVISWLISSVLPAILLGFISWIISKISGMQFSNILFYVSIGLILIGALSMMKGNPSGASLSDMGQQNAQYGANVTLEAVRSQQESTDYHNNFKRHSIVEFSFKGISLVLGGGILIIYNILFSL